MSKKYNMNENSLKNLKPIRSADDERLLNSRKPEARAKAVKKTKETLENKRRRNAFAEDLKYILSLPISSDEVIDIKEIDNFDKLGESDNATVQDIILKSLIVNAKNGDDRAFEIIRDTIGEKAAEKVDIKQEKHNTMTDMIELLKKRNDDIKKESDD